MSATFRYAGWLAICFAASASAQGLMAPKDAMPTAQGDGPVCRSGTSPTVRAIHRSTQRQPAQRRGSHQSRRGVDDHCAEESDGSFLAVCRRQQTWRKPFNWRPTIFTRTTTSPKSVSATATPPTIIRRNSWRFASIPAPSKSSPIRRGAIWAEVSRPTCPMLHDEAHAAADAQRALELDPRLRADLENEANGIRERNRQSACAQQAVRRMGAYMVNHSARTAQQCAAIKGFWTAGECRISTAMAPGPVMAGGRDAATANAGLLGQGCGPVDATDHKYSPRAGGYVVK